MIIESLIVGAVVGTAGYFSTRYAWWRRPVPYAYPRVVMYHMVREHRPGTRFNRLRVPPALFEKQVAWMRRRGFEFIFASDLFADRPLPEKCVCLTFDDGYEDNLTHADAVLARHNAVATVYLVAERDGGWSSKKKAHHSDGEIASEPKLSDAQVRQMLETGRWELGGHTRTHANLPALPAAEAKDEIASPRDTFQRDFGVTPPTFAYPFGIYNPEHTDMVRDAGYSGALTTEMGIAPHPYAEPMDVPRVKASGTEGMLGFVIRMRSGARGLFK